MLLLPCLAYTGYTNVGPIGMQHLSKALETNESLTSLDIGGTLGGTAAAAAAGSEGGRVVTRKSRGCVWGRYKAA